MEESYALDTSADEEAQLMPQPKVMAQPEKLVNLRNTVLQGSFLPATLMASRGEFNINQYVFDPA